MESLIIKSDEHTKQLQSWEMNEEIQIFREYLRFPTVHPNINYRRSFALKFRSSSSSTLNAWFRVHTSFAHETFVRMLMMILFLNRRLDIVFMSCSTAREEPEDHLLIVDDWFIANFCLRYYINGLFLFRQSHVYNSSRGWERTLDCAYKSSVQWRPASPSSFYRWLERSQN